MLITLIALSGTNRTFWDDFSFGVVVFSQLGKNFAFVPFCMAWTSRRVELERVFEIDGTPCCVMNGDGFVAAFPVVDGAK